MKSVFIFAGTQLKRFTRDKTALFFTLVFPLIFLFVFGSIFKNDDVSLKIAIFNNSSSEFSKTFVDESKKDDSTLKVVDVSSFDEAKDQMNNGELDSIIELPESFGQPNAQGLPSGEMTVYYDEASPQSGQTVASIMSGIVDGMNQQIIGQKPLLTVSQKATASSGLTSFDYIISGLLGFTVLSLSIFGLANQLPAEKKTGVLKRIRATPFSRTKLILGTMLYYGTIGLLALTIMVLAAVFILHFDMRGSWLQLAMFAIISLAAMLGFGILIGGWAKNENQSAVLSNLISFPMMFLSGTFFPRYLMPEWLQGITGYLPLTPIVDGFRYITTEGATLLDLGPQLAIIAAWGVVIYVLAIRLFRWE